MAVYFGLYTNDENSIVSVDARPLSPRHDLLRYADHLNCRDPAGALQLALAILAHHCAGNERRALALHHYFHEQLVIYLPDVWMLDSMEVEATLMAFETDCEPGAIDWAKLLDQVSGR